MADATAKLLITAEDRTKAAFDSIAKNFQQLKSVGAAAVAFKAVYETMKMLGEAGLRAEQSSNRLTVAFERQGEQIGLTRKQLDEFADSQAEATQFDDNSFKKAEAELMKFGNIYGDVFTQALKLSADLAAFNGTDLVTANDALGRALANPVQGLKQLESQIGKMTPAQKEFIKNAIESGDALKAQNAILDVVRQKVGGTAEFMNTGYTKAIEDVAKAWDKLTESLVGITLIKDTVVGTLEAIAGALRGVASVFQGGSLSEGILGKQGALAQQITDLQTQIDTAKKRQGLTFTDDQGRVMGEDLHVDDMEKQLAQLEAQYKKLYQTQEARPKAGRPKFGMTDEQLAFIKQIRQQTDAVGQGPIGTLFAKADELHLGDKTHAQIQALGLAIQEVADETDRAKDSFASWQKAFGFTDSMNEQTKELVFNTSQLGKGTDQIALNTAEWRINNDIRKISNSLTGDQKTAFDQLAGTMQGDYMTALVDSQYQQRKWQVGFQEAMNEITDNATNAARQIHDLFTGAFKSLEDALVNFTMTGKLNFRDFANSVIEQLIRIRIQQSVIAPLSGALSEAGGGVGSFLNFFGIGNSPSGTASVGPTSYGPTSTGGLPGRAVGGPVTANQPYWVGERGPELFMPSTGGNIVPNGAAGGVSIVQHNTFGSGLNTGEIALMLERNKSETVSLVHRTIYRGGAMKKEIRR